MSHKFNSLNSRYNVQNYQRNTRSIIAAPSTSAEPSTSGIKRTADVSSSDLASQSNQSAKAGRIVGTVASLNSVADSTSLLADAEMPLTGTGAEQASGGASSDGQELVHYTSVPRSHFGDNISIYKKVHKVMTFGLAPNIIASTNETQPDRAARAYLTTHLAQVPWELPALYMTPSEFQLLHPGAHCESVHIKITYRGSTIQFQTNQTVTNLATLNQINDITIGKALNKTGWGSNGRYTSFADGNPMVPTGVINATSAAIPGVYRGLLPDLYGSNNDEGTFMQYIPHHQVGTHTFLYNHFLLTTRTAAGTPSSTDLWGGWPCIAEKLEQMDGKTCVNTVVCEMEYKPKIAPLKIPLQPYFFGLPKPTMDTNNTIQIATNGNLVAGRVANVSVDSTAPTAPLSDATLINNVSETEANLNTYGPDLAQTLTQYTYIEKSQWMRSGFWGQADCHVQPSCHIGIQPVPSLTTSALLTDNTGANQWTDCRGYWEIEATMVVKQHEPTAFPYAQYANVPLGSHLMKTSAIPPGNGNGALFAGLFTQTDFEL